MEVTSVSTTAIGLGLTCLELTVSRTPVHPTAAGHLRLTVVSASGATSAYVGSPTNDCGKRSQYCHRIGNVGGGQGRLRRSIRPVRSCIFLQTPLIFLPKSTQAFKRVLHHL